MDVFLEQLLSPWGIRAMIASSLVGIMCGVLGAFIVLRNMSLIGDALAHAILPGIFVSFVIVGYSVIGFFIGSVIAGLITAFGITWVQQHAQTKNDAAIGIVFSAMFAIGIMGISKVSKAGVHLDLQDFLFGTVLGISSEDIYLTLGVTIYVVLSVIIFYRYLFITTFQPTIAKAMGINVKLVHYFLMFLLSFAVVSALRSVGVILVVAMLITPASTALLLSTKLERVVLLAGIIGLIGANIGLVLAILFDTNPGPAMTVTVTFIYLLAVFFSPKKGLLFKYIKRRKQSRKIINEDILRQAIKKDVDIPLNIEEIAERLGISMRKIQPRLAALKKEDLLRKQDGKLFLSEAGVHRANELVRAHRLWESYMVDRLGLGENEIHEEADRLEHHLTKEILDEVDSSLGYPETDPHGSPIPKKSTILLTKAALNKTYKIQVVQSSNDIDAQLWELGILPNEPIKILRKTSQYVEILFHQRRYKIKMPLANQVMIQ